MAQTALVGAALGRLQPAPVLEVVPIITTGDRRLDVSLLDPGPALERGLFTREIEAALLSGDVDVAVHSLKDLPTELPDGLELAGVLPRENPADLLVTRTPGGLRSLPASARVGTSSARRACQLLRLRPDLQIVEIRGNVPTRLAKLAADDALHALVLARAGLVRLGLLGADGSVHAAHGPLAATELVEMLPAPGQGMIGLEIKRDHAVARAWVERINSPESWACACAERAFLRLINGGCATPVGVRSSVTAGRLRLETVVFAGEAKPRSGRVEAARDDPEGAAVALLEMIYGD